MLFGGIVLIFCIVLLVLSWVFFKKEEQAWALFFLVLTGLLIRTFVSLDPYLHPWDERYHALVAKNMMSHPLLPTLYENPVLPYDYKAWVGNHIWVHKQPIPLWGMSASIKIFGANYFAIRIPSILLSGLGVILLYHIGKRLFNPRVGWFAAFFFAIHGLISELVGGRMPTDHIDVYFSVFVLLAILSAILFAEKKSVWWNVLCGVAIGLAILTKWLPALIVLPIWLMLVIHHKFSFKQWFLHGLVLVTVILIVALPWQLYIHASFPKEAAWESHFNVMHLYMDLDGQGRPFWYFFDTMRMTYGELIYIPVLWFMYKAVQLKKDWRYWSVLVWFLIPYLFFSISVTKMQGYVLFSAGALFLITAIFIDKLLNKDLIAKYNWLRYMVLVLLIALPLRFAYERLRPFQPTREIPDWQQEINAFDQETNQPERTIVFNTEHPVEYMFHTDVVAYPGLPTNSILDSLNAENYTIYIVNEKHVPELWEPVKN